MDIQNLSWIWTNITGKWCRYINNIIIIRENVAKKVSLLIQMHIFLDYLYQIHDLYGWYNSTINIIICGTFILAHSSVSGIYIFATLLYLYYYFLIIVILLYTFLMFLMLLILEYVTLEFTLNDIVIVSNFYIITTFHGLHMIVGIILVLFITYVKSLLFSFHSTLIVVVLDQKDYYEVKIREFGIARSRFELCDYVKVMNNCYCYYEVSNLFLILFYYHFIECLWLSLDLAHYFNYIFR